MGAFVVVERLEVSDQDGFREYLAAVSPTIESRGGRYHVASTDVEVLEGGWAPASLVLFEFPSRQAALEWWGSADYASLKALRQRSSRHNIVLAPGLS
jgi:uncharacterized protein (DUF1330 family)